jgi:hypothetical protein
VPRRPLLALAFVATAAFGACGSGPAPSTIPSSSGGTATRDWCLNTAQEVGAAIGGTAVTAKGTTAPEVGGACIYTTADGKLVYTVATINSEAATGTFQAVKSSQGVVQVPGIGDDAILMSPQGPLAILKGSAFISIGFLPAAGITDPTEMRTKLEQLARLAVDRY